MKILEDIESVDRRRFTAYMSALGLGGTVYITAVILLSAIYLICWDADKIYSAGVKLFAKREGPKLLEGAIVIEKSAWITGGIVGIGLLLATRGFIPTSLRVELFFVGVVAFLVVVASWIHLAVKGVRQARSPAADS